MGDRGAVLQVGFDLVCIAWAKLENRGAGSRLNLRNGTKKMVSHPTPWLSRISFWISYQALRSRRRISPSISCHYVWRR